MRAILCTVLGLLLTFGMAVADSPPSKDADKPAIGTEGDVTCADGKTVRIALQNDAVAIETKYGKLLIPAADIERIDFAFRLPDDIAKKIDAAMKRLGNDNFKERETASKELLAIGARAFPALQAATKSSDAEVAERAVALIDELRAKAPKDSLKFSKVDRIKTASCTVSGRITSDVKLVPTSRPGAAALSLTELRVFQSWSTLDPNVERGTEVGKAALEIEAEDIDGKKIKLSGYRGKVVLLHFWGHWCPPCRAMYPQLNSLVSKLADEPFVLLGVNSDKDRDAVKKVLAAEKLAWRSFWNGGSTSGAISREWKVQGWPTLYLIDRRGVIRQKWTGSPGDEKMKKAVEALVKEAGEKE